MHPPLSPEAWARASALFDQALDLPAEARAAWLAGVERDDAAAAGHVRALLAAHADQPAVDRLERGPQITGPRVDADAGLAAGLRIGPWQLLAPLGSGGMASVWRAARADGAYQREVALKLPRNGLPDPAAARFAHERDILARLEHPNIARLYDANLGETSRPWLAIEQVDGQPLDRWCRDRQLPVPQRLALFIQVLQAVQHAHSHLVLHRDLKASNILVTPQGQVKLLDFGIAALLQGPGLTAADAPRSACLMTPAFAAPEQIENGTLSTATDVYAAGVVLFELLTGARPYRTDSGAGTDTPARLEAAILHGERLPASLACTPEAARTAGLSHPRLRRALSGDLDAILRLALQRDPARRYGSAQAFAADLQRHLAGLPVRARPPTLGYRLGCFLGRHRALAGVGAVATVCVVAAVGVAGWQARIASLQQARAQAAQAANEAGSAFMADLLNDALRAGQPINADQLVARAERMARQSFAGKPDQLAAVLWMVSQRAGEWDGHERSRTLVREALALARDPDLRNELTCEDAYIQAQLGELAPATARLQALADNRQALPAARACALGYLAFMAGQAARLPEALALQERAIGLIAQAPVVPDHLRAAMTARLGLFKIELGRGQEGDRHFTRALSLMADGGRERSRSAWTVRNEWAIALSAAGDARQALQLSELNLRLLTEDSGFTPTTLYTARGTAALMAVLGRFEQSQALLDRSLAQAAAAGDAVTAEMQRAIECDRALQHTVTQRRDAAAQALARADEVQRRSSASDTFYDVGCRLARAEFEIALGDAAQGLAVVQAVLADPSGARPALQSRTRVLAARAHLALNQPGPALEQAEQALKFARQLQADRPLSFRTGYALLWLGAAQAVAGQRVPARATLQQAVDQLQGSVDASHPWLIDARQRLAALGSAR